MSKHKKKHPDDAPVPETPPTPPTPADHDAASDDGMPVADESEDD